jgi:hypothetical protein
MAESDATTSYGQVAYEAYAGMSRGRSLVSGATLPKWKDTSDDIRNAWEAAARAVREAQGAGYGEAGGGGQPNQPTAAQGGPKDG